MYKRTDSEDQSRKVSAPVETDQSERSGEKG